MILSFKHAGLSELLATGKSKKISADLHKRAKRRLDALNAASAPTDMNVPGFNFHALKGLPQRYSVHVNGPWCITFEWLGADATQVDLEQYH